MTIQATPGQPPLRAGDQTQTAAELQEIWDTDPRWDGVERTYTAEDVVRLRGSVREENTLARRGAENLWNLLHTARRLKDAERPTAFLCGSVFQARGVYRAIAENGLSVGGDVSVICHDDGVRGCGAADLTPPLTATATSIRGAGEELALILIEMIEGRATQPVRKILPFELILRDSVGLAGPHGRRSGKAADPEGPNRALP